MMKWLAAILVLLICQNTYAQRLFGGWPAGGGNITVQTLDGPIEALGIEFVAEPGILTQGRSAAPFTFFIPNSAEPGNVTLGALGTPVTLDGSVELDVRVSASATHQDVSGYWGNGTTPVRFTVGFPEPSSLGIAMTGMLPLLLCRKRRS